MPLLIHTVSHTIHLLMTCNYRCLLLLTKYLCYFNQRTHVWVMSKHGQLSTCLNMMTTRHCSCLSPQKELSISIAYLLQSLFGNAQIPFKQSVKNLSFALDCHLTMNAHVSNIAWTCYFGLHRLASIHRFLKSTSTATFVSPFVLSRIDCCNSLLFSSTHDVTSNLQQMQNYAAQVILRLPMSSSMTTHLKSLHWLPVKVRNTYKIACLSYHCHSSTAPSYVTDMLHIKPSHTRNTRSSSYTMHLLNIPAHSKATLGDHLFSFASSVRNSIPIDVRCANHCHHLCLV